MSDTPPPAQGTTRAAGRSFDEGAGRSFPCASCGADLEFHIGLQELRCGWCGHVEPIADDGRDVAERDLRAALEAQAERRSEADGDATLGRAVVCDSCGGAILFTDRLLSTHCPYCASPVQRDDVHDAPDRLPIDGVLPFRIERDAARNALRAWLDGRWFLPGAFRRLEIDDRLHGLYVPFWTFDAMTHTRYVGERGEHYWVTRGTGKKRKRVRKTRWYPARGSFSRFFDDVLVFAGKHLPRSRVRALEPWPLHHVEPFRQEFLAGKLAEGHDVELPAGFRIAEERIEAAILEDVRRRIGGDTQRVHEVRSRWPGLSYKYLLLPVWVMSHRYRGKHHRLLVNAATGEVQGERPYDWLKITLVVLLVVAAGVATWYLTQP